MKKLIFILIVGMLFVGCEKSTTESSIDPLVGVWEGTEMLVTYTSGDLNGVSFTMPLGENTEMGTTTWIFGADGVASMTSTDSYGTESDNGTWSSTGGKLTLMGDGETTVIDFTISGNTLTVNFEDMPMPYSITLIRQ